MRYEKKHYKKPVATKEYASYINIALSDWETTKAWYEKYRARQAKRDAKNKKETYIEQQ